MWAATAASYCPSRAGELFRKTSLNDGMGNSVYCDRTFVLMYWSNTFVKGNPWIRIRNVYGKAQDSNTRVYNGWEHCDILSANLEEAGFYQDIPHFAITLEKLWMEQSHPVIDRMNERRDADSWTRMFVRSVRKRVPCSKARE